MSLKNLRELIRLKLMSEGVYLHNKAHEIEHHGRGDGGSSDTSLKTINLPITNEIIKVFHKKPDMYDDPIESSLQMIVEYLAYHIYEVFNVNIPQHRHLAT